MGIVLLIASMDVGCNLLRQQNAELFTKFNSLLYKFIDIYFFFEPRGGSEWVPTVRCIFKLVPQSRLMSARTGSARKE